MTQRNKKVGGVETRESLPRKLKREGQNRDKKNDQCVSFHFLRCWEKKEILSGTHAIVFSLLFFSANRTREIECLSPISLFFNSLLLISLQPNRVLGNDKFVCENWLSRNYESTCSHKVGERIVELSFGEEPTLFLVIFACSFYLAK